VYLFSRGVCVYVCVWMYVCVGVGVGAGAGAPLWSSGQSS
jgi:hypothetical protein